MLLSGLFVLALSLVPALSMPTGRLAAATQLLLLRLLRAFIVCDASLHGFKYSVCVCVADTAGGTLLQQCFQDAKKLVDDAYLYSREE